MAWLVALTSLAATRAVAGGLDVDAWIQKPGVKLLAVEFYATWCKPCMEAVPKWKSLHEKYRKLGLRLVVVSTQDPGGVCANPGWMPDETVCDVDGEVAQRFGVQGLPSAFLWTWEGHQLAGRTHVLDIEAAIETWMKRAPRVEVSVGTVPKSAKVGSEALRKLVVDELDRSGKLVVVANEAERRQLAALRKRQFEPGYDESAQCEVGKELPPNSLLEASVIGDGNRSRLALQLHSAETGCLSASGLADLDVDHPDRAVAEAVATLISKIRAETQRPPAEQPAPGVRDLVRQVIEDHAGQVRKCYEVGLAKDPELSGKVEISWEISRDGTVRSVELKEDTLKAGAVSRCLRSSILSWKFPNPTGTLILVQYPFVFSTST